MQTGLRLFCIPYDVADLTVQNIAESGQYIGINSLHSTGTPLFHNFKTRVCQFGKTVACNASGVDQFLQMNRNPAVGVYINNTA